MLSDIRFISKTKKVLNVRNPGMNKAEVLHRLSITLRQCNQRDKLRMTTVSCRYPIIRGHLEPANRGDMLNNANETFCGLGIEFNLFSILEVLKNNSGMIKDLNQAKKEAEYCIVSGNFSRILEILDEFDATYGKTLWSFDLRFAVMSRKSSPQELADKIESITNSDSEKHILSILFKKYTSHSLESFFKNGFKDLLNEYRQNEANAFIDVVSTLLVPPFYDRDRSIDHILFGIEILGTIDKYIVVKKALSDYFYQNSQSCNHKIYIDFVKKMKELTDDIFWKNLDLYILGKYDIHESEIKEKVIRLYSGGYYRESIDACNEIISSNSNDLSIIDIKAKSILHLYDKDEIDNIHENEKFNSEFEKLIVTSLIMLHVDPVRYDVHIELMESFKFKYLHLDALNSIMPYSYISYPFINNKKLREATYELYLSGYELTEKLVPYLFDNSKDHVSSIGEKYIDCLSESRLKRYHIQNELNKSPSEINFEFKGIEELEKYSDITKSELESIKVNYYLSTKKYRNLFSLISRNCIKKQENNIMYPLKFMVNLLEDNESYREEVSAVICAYIYNVTSEEYRGLTSEVLEDFLTSKEVDKPSDLLKGVDVLNEEDFYFFEKVCNTNLMSDLICFTSSKELLLERMKIVKFLISISVNSSDSLLLEEKKIFSDLLAHNLVSKHEKNKIYIDSNGILLSQSKEYKFLIENILVLSSLQEDFIDILYEDMDESSIKESQTKKRAFIYKQFYTKIIEDYINNSNYGLVRSLSSEIRHGVLPNQIRSVLEALNLVTIVDVEGDYMRNEYWSDYNLQIASENFVDYIDKCLKEFSSEIDALIVKINSWPRVDTSLENNEAVFKFPIDADSIEQFRLFIEPEITKLPGFEDGDITEEDVVNILHQCEEYIWLQIESAFLQMKKNLNEIAKPEFLNIFRSLKQKINRSSVNLAKLNLEIDNASSRVNEEINKIESWFRKPDESIDGEITIYDTILSSFECINSIHNPRVIEVDVVGIRQEECNRLISMKVALGLVRALVSIYQNCLKHGKDGPGTKISLSSYMVNDSNDICLTASNDISEEKYSSVVEHDYVNKVASFTLSNENEKLVHEGKTGLYKIYRYIVDSSDCGSFEIDFDESSFYQKVFI